MSRFLLLLSARRAKHPARRMLNEAHFFLLMDSHATQANLMAECSLCGAITEQPLQVAWFEGVVECSNCGIQMPLYQSVFDALRQQAVEAQSAIEALPTRETLLSSARREPARTPIVLIVRVS